MSSTTSNVSPRQDTYWWQGSVMEIKARAEDAGGAIDAEVVGEHLVQRLGMAVALGQDAGHLGLDIGQDGTKLGPDVHARRVPDLFDQPCHGIMIRLRSRLRTSPDR